MPPQLRRVNPGEVEMKCPIPSPTWRKTPAAARSIGPPTGRLLIASDKRWLAAIYESLSPDGKNLTPLTPGNCAVEHWQPTPDRLTGPFNSNCGSLGDIDRRHLLAADVTGGNTR